MMIYNTYFLLNWRDCDFFNCVILKVYSVNRIHVAWLMVARETEDLLLIINGMYTGYVYCILD